jgi:hypothetical protein
METSVAAVKSNEPKTFWEVYNGFTHGITVALASGYALYVTDASIAANVNHAIAGAPGWVKAGFPIAVAVYLNYRNGQKITTAEVAPSSKQAVVSATVADIK